jgi:hypothetical protein
VACFALHSLHDDSGMRLSVSQTGLAHLLLIGSVLSRLKGGTGSKRDKKMFFRTGSVKLNFDRKVKARPMEI